MRRNAAAQGYQAIDTPSEPRPLRQSIRSTYDARETGPRFHVTYRVGGRTIEHQQPIEDPFVRGTVVVGWRDLVRGLLRRHLEVEVLVGGDRDIVEDVMELNDDYLGVANSTRRQTWDSHVNERLSALADDLPD